jgi:adenylate cyclase
MGTEIERKFLLRDESWRDAADGGTRFRQGYLIGAERASVRVRIEGDRANLNIKSATLGIHRQEYEYPIPLGEAEELLDTLCEQPQIIKTRYLVPYGEHTWEIDLFDGDNAGLIVAEVELEAEDETFERPPWLGDEVSGDTRYYNVCLVNHPYKDWT